MVTLVIFLNLFFAPCVALWIQSKRNNEELHPSLRFFVQYAILSVCNVPLTKIGVALCKKISGRTISIDSGYYTLLAVLAAVILPGLLDRMRRLYAGRAELLKTGKANLTRRSLKYRQKLPTAFLFVFLSVIAYVIRGPLEIYAGNAKEFLFTVGDFLPWLILTAAGIVVLIGCMIAALPDEPFHIASALLLWFGAASWIQDLFLNQVLIGTQGDRLDWSSLGSLPKRNLIVWIAILIVILLFYVFQKERWCFITKLTAGVLCFTQLIAVGSVFLKMPPKMPPEFIVSGEEQMMLAAEDNLIVLLFDTVSTSDIAGMMEAYPEAKEIVKDFVYYDNACCDHHFTYPSFTHFMTGNEMQFNTNAPDWLYDSWHSDRCNRFFQILKDDGYKRQFNVSQSFTEATQVGGIENLTGKADNIQQQPLQVNTDELLQKLFKLSAFRCLPYVWKRPFEVLTSDFDDLVVPANTAAASCGNVEFYQRLKSEKLSVNPDLKKLFSYTHLAGAHPPRVLDAQLNVVEQASDADITRGLFMILDEYFEQMKALGIYDSATIIIMSDHGTGTPEGMAPMVYIKRPHETRKSVEVNSAPISYSDFQATILELIGKNDGSFGTSFYDWTEGQTRRRVVYKWAVDETRPKVETSTPNVHYGYVYYKDAEELRQHILTDGPDYIETANTWCYDDEDTDS